MSPLLLAVWLQALPAAAQTSSADCLAAVNEARSLLAELEADPSGFEQPDETRKSLLATIAREESCRLTASQPAPAAPTAKPLSTTSGPSPNTPLENSPSAVLERRRRPERRRPVAPAVVIAMFGLAWALYGRRWLAQRARLMAREWVVAASALAALMLALAAWHSIPPASIMIGAGGGAGAAAVALPVADAAVAAGAVVVGARAASSAVSRMEGGSSPGSGNPEPTSGNAEGIEAAWDKATFDDKASSIRYHHREHGKGRDVGTYTRDAVDFYQKFKSRARPHRLQDGRMGVKIRTKDHFGIYTEEGKIVSYQ